MSCQFRTCLFTLAALVLSGCSGNEQYPTALVSGTVTSNGTPVPEGTIMFSPIAQGKKTLIGKPATGAIKDGEFILSTFENGDGAVVGTHAVIVKGKEIPPDDPRDIEWGRAPKWGSTSEQFIVAANVENEFQIELTPPPPKKKKRKKNDDDEDDD